MEKKQRLNLGLLILFMVFLLTSRLISFFPGIKIGENFMHFAFNMLKVLPPAFILIGLFEVWVKQETIENNFGHQSGFKGYILAILLAGTTVGGTYVAFPVAYSLYNKGAKYSIIFTYIGAAALVRVPMALFEASFLGIKFTLIRLTVSLPLIILSSILLGRYLEKSGYMLPKSTLEK